MLGASTSDIGRYGRYKGGVALPPHGHAHVPVQVHQEKEVLLMTYNRLALSSPKG